MQSIPQCITCARLVRPNICSLSGEYIKPLAVHDCREWQMAPMDMMKLRLAPGMKFDEKNIVRMT